MCRQSSNSTMILHFLCAKSTLSNMLDKFVESEKNPTLEWKGSSNQRVIDVKESKKCHRVVTL